MLYIVSTPIGNLGDITYRAVEVLKAADIIVCEDTRTAGLLLKAYGIPKKPFISYNDHNSRARIPYVIGLLAQGQKIALISERGTPGISDPGFRLIRECAARGIIVSPVPGASAILASLVGSGLPTDSFTFYGFLPKSDKQKKDIFRSEEVRRRTSIFYESPNRLLKTLVALQEALPQRRVCICRELTKKFEEFIRGTPEELAKVFSAKTPKGEFVMIVSPEEKA